MSAPRRTFAVAILAATAFATSLLTWQSPSGSAGQNGKPEKQMSRRDFAKAMSKVKIGMQEKEIIALLGKPDDVQTQHDSGGISTYRTKEIWRYGTNGHLTFPTLGTVYIDNAGKAQYFYGGSGKPIDPKIFPESELRSLLRLIDDAPGYHSGYSYNPLTVIQIVNTLQPLGKEKALAAIEEYLRVCSFLHSPGREGVSLVLRALFEVPADPGYMPEMLVGGPVTASFPKDPKEFPRFPIMLEDDVPIMLVSGYNVGGEAPNPAPGDVKYFREKGTIRKRPLMPSKAPLSLLSVSAKKADSLYDDPKRGKLLIANQLLHLVDSVYRRDVDKFGDRFRPDRDVDGHWKAVEAEVAKFEIRWNAEKNRYTFEDGTHLPDPVRVLHRRHIWKLEGLNGEAELIIERTDKNRVWVCLQWEGKKGQDPPLFALQVFAAQDKEKCLAETNKIGIGSWAGNQIFSSQSFHVELVENEGIQATLRIGDREQRSPIYTP